jgi:hypothetical protein
MADEGGSQGGRVYFIRCTETNRIKIGFTAGPLEARFANIQTANASDLVLIGSLPGTRALEDELKRRFRKDRIRGEWFCLSRELFVFICREVPPHPGSVNIETCYGTWQFLEGLERKGITYDQYLADMAAGTLAWPPSPDDPYLSVFF